MKNFINQITLLFFIIGMTVTPGLLTAQTWDTASSNNGLYSTSRISLGSSSTIPSDGRMHIRTVNDRYGLYIENATPVSTLLGGTSYDLCLAELDGNDYEDIFYGIYASIPANSGGFGYAGMFDGHLGVCGSIWLNSAASGGGFGDNGWQFNPNSYLGGFAINHNGSASFVLNKAPSSDSPFLRLNVEDLAYTALSVYKQGESEPYFDVNGKGHIESSSGMTINTHFTGKSFRIQNTAGDEKFYVFNDGFVWTKKGVEVEVDNNTTDDPYKVYNKTTNQDKFRVNKDGKIWTQKVIEIDVAGSSTEDAIVVKAPHPSTDKEFRVAKDGKTWAREIRVTQEIIPDYVFEKDYDLMPLSEIERYVKEHKHLPNIPSEKEIKADGLNLGDQQMKQLEKIEELTLHLIAINKRLETLEKENKLLKGQVKSLSLDEKD